MRPGKIIENNWLEKVEDGLERLSIQMIVILKEYKEKGIIGEKEYIEHIECKRDFLIYLSNKRQKVFVE